MPDFSRLSPRVVFLVLVTDAGSHTRAQESAALLPAWGSKRAASHSERKLLNSGSLGLSKPTGGLPWGQSENCACTEAGTSGGGWVLACTRPQMSRKGKALRILVSSARHDLPQGK